VLGGPQIPATLVVGGSKKLYNDQRALPRRFVKKGKKYENKARILSWE
jgi:hypothetical protein